MIVQQSLKLNNSKKGARNQMKKIVITFILSLVLSISVFADGETHNGGRSCPQGQTCFAGSTPGQRAEKPNVSRFYKEIKDIFVFLKIFLPR
jgi:hypothetical protein